MIPQKLKMCKTCGKPSYLFSHGNCKPCATRAKNSLVQTESGKEAKLFKYQTKEIKKVSTRQQKLNAAYSIQAVIYKKNNPICKARIKCSGALTTDVHHRKGRGEYLLDESSWLPVCRECHVWINENNKQAMALGLSESRLSKAI